ncbi:S-adenosyl-L-methionine-dependent methyltransferase [Vararia minispora EC-137]|uniref:S-adenosyl-L-methionine-dependent methyltransferase n=1 Tax=Vararia minispora EC-137 TaxID=1314806 RepID=A0ACB8QC58_9AGAM|nr:S-adenosyl-L-methionine-dependent methyltransferase [Vararia minispora EC-137]
MIKEIPFTFRTYCPPAPAIEHVGRNYQRFPGAGYVLPSDELERDRLLLQHNLLKRNFNNTNLIFPYNPLKAYTVLDSGTGAGVWLLDVAKDISPTSMLQGVDIEDGLFPQQNVSSNMSFLVASVTSLPPKWSGLFDIIHQRLLRAALTESEWVAAVKEFNRVLQPGGWVQLAEPGHWTAGPATERWQELVDRLLQFRGFPVDIQELLPGLLRRCGFTGVHIERRSLMAGKWDGAHGCEVRDNFMGVYRGMKTPLLKLGCFGILSSEQELDNLYDAVEKEWDEMEGCSLTFLIVIGQKHADL